MSENKINLEPIPTQLDTKPRHRIYFRLFSAAQRLVGVPGMSPAQRIENLEVIRESLLDALAMLEIDISTRKALVDIEANFHTTAEEPTQTVEVEETDTPECPE